MAEFINALRTYATQDPKHMSPAVALCYSDFSVTIFDKFPKSTYHFVLLPLIRPPLGEEELHNLHTVVNLPKEQAKTVLENIQRDALEAKKLIEEEMVRAHGFKWDIQMGFHAAPSLPHIHLHIMSTDFCGKYMNKKKHFNSFHPKLGFFLHLDDVLSWFEPDIDPTYFKSKKQINNHGSKFKKLLKEDMICAHCDTHFKTWKPVDAHLHKVFDQMVEEHKKKAARAQAMAKRLGAKRKAEAPDPEKTTLDESEEARPAKRKVTGPAPTDSKSSQDSDAT